MIDDVSVHETDLMPEQASERFNPRPPLSGESVNTCALPSKLPLVGIARCNVLFAKRLTFLESLYTNGGQGLGID